MINLIIKKVFLVTMLLFCMNITYAAAKLPANCVSNAYNHVEGKLVLEAMQEDPKQRLFLMKNISSYNLTLKHTDEKSFMDLGWETTLDRDKWSALVIDNKDIPIQCLVSVEDNINGVSCQDALEVCLLERTQFALSSPGSFWLAQNTSLHTVLTSFRKNGIKILRVRK